jgi:hypothetical protein
MVSGERQAFRVVVQRLADAYLLIAYNGIARNDLVPARFASLQELLKRFRSVGVFWPESELSAADNHEAVIVFAEVLELDETQLSTFGLKPQKAL